MKKVIVPVSILVYFFGISFPLSGAGFSPVSDADSIRLEGIPSVDPFSFERFELVADDTPSLFVIAVSRLLPGETYLLSAPYADFVLLRTSGAVRSVSGGTLVFMSDASAISFQIGHSPNSENPENASRGISVRPLSIALLHLILWGGILTCLILSVLFINAMMILGRHGAREGRLFLFFLSLSFVIVCLSAFAPIAAFFFQPLPIGLVSRLRSLGLVFFLVAARGYIASVGSSRFFSFSFYFFVCCGVLVSVFSIFSSYPPGIASFTFSTLSALFSVIDLYLLIATRYRSLFPVVLSSLFSALLFSFSAVVWSPDLESAFSCAGALPLFFVIVASLKSRSNDSSSAPLLSDYVDRVSLAFTRFIPREFLSILNKETVAELALGDHVKRDMTIFFSDIRQFSALSEALTPEENFKFINSYLSRVVPVVREHGGFIDKYVGDAIMALFPNATGADSAVKAAIEMQRKIVEYNGHRANCGYRPLSMGIGLHTGTLMLGVVGVADHMENTVISDAVNLASRLEGITKVFNISLAISEGTFKSLQDPGSYMYRFIGKVRVKGKNEPVSVFEIFDGVSPDDLDRKMRANRFFEQGMLCYYQKEFSGAMHFFRKVLEVLPEDGASTFYLDNCIAKARG